ncbi:carbohydrate ABC transporter permease [Pacificibacter marinus]|uniref:Trehalose transport system permease protein SugA n=1 Tax=Pacificibacter marinus TaxID=658057 RepID=A0A1Y5RQU6_9RHOB|nr:sugar ABC transporter permease [Pacificibacter marinus]SEL30928.1 carbohydrate ABC transporter membrane protein 1, CUT1 family [Pacificibacter marinus]SLN22208.1 Trehalose transport system permease protein SugA [Pacificibacter marinus]
MTDMTSNTPSRSQSQSAADEGAGREEKRLGFALTLPAQLLVLFIALFPILMQVYISLTDWSPLDGIPWYRAYELWIGLTNYVDLAGDPRFWSAIWRTLIVMLICVPVQFLLGLGLAILFVDEFPGRRAMYSTILVPMMVVPAVAGYMFFMLFQSGGPINGILSFLLGSSVQIAWLSDPDLALLGVIISDIWQWTPLMFLILLAGMLSVPQDQQMAAVLLGAGWWRRFFTIVLPRMKTIIVIAIAIRVIENFKVFDNFYIITGGGPGVATETISIYIYKVTQNDLIWGYVAAIALAILIVLSIVSGMAISRMRKG